MDYKLIIEIAVMIAGLVAAWQTMRIQLGAAERALEELARRVKSLEENGAARALAAAEKLHSRVDQHGEEIIRLEGKGQRLNDLFEAHAKHMESGMARIEVSMSSMLARLEVLSSRRRSRDEETPP